MEEEAEIKNAFYKFITAPSFPCVAAKDALAKKNIKVMIAGHIGCPFCDKNILNFIYDFTSNYRQSTSGFHSIAIIFTQPHFLSEELFDTFMWQRLQALQNLDATNFAYNKTVDANPTSSKFSFSLMEEAFFIVGLHANNSRPSRQFQYPTLIFNPHQQFEQLKNLNRYEKMKAVVRKRDVALAGSINPMLTDFGQASEVYQYSGKVYDELWQCPLQIKRP